MSAGADDGDSDDSGVEELRDDPERVARDRKMSVSEVIRASIGCSGRFAGYGLAGVRVGDLRTLVRGDESEAPQGVMACATNEDPLHGVVWDRQQRLRKSAAAKAIARKAFWVVPLIA